MRQKRGVNELLQQWRIDARLSQEQLSDLTFELAEAGTIDTGIKRQHISRLESGAVGDPQPQTLLTMSRALAEAFRRAGFEGGTAEELYQHLINSKRTRMAAREVSPQAAELDAILAPLHPSNRAIIYAGLIANAIALKAELLKSEALRKRIAKSDSNDMQSG